MVRLTPVRTQHLRPRLIGVFGRIKVAVWLRSPPRKFLGQTRRGYTRVDRVQTPGISKLYLTPASIHGAAVGIIRRVHPRHVQAVSVEHLR